MIIAFLIVVAIQFALTIYFTNTTIALSKNQTKETIESFERGFERGFETVHQFKPFDTADEENLQKNANEAFAADLHKQLYEEDDETIYDENKYAEKWE